MEYFISRARLCDLTIVEIDCSTDLIENSATQLGSRLPARQIDSMEFPRAFIERNFIMRNPRCSKIRGT